MNGEKLSLEIVTPEGLFLKTRADLVEFPTQEGELGIFSGHMPMFVDLGAGELRVHNDGQFEGYAVAGGFVQITPVLVRVLASFATTAEEEQGIEAACQRAKTAMEIAATESPAAIAAELRDLRNELMRMKTRPRKRRGVK